MKIREGLLRRRIAGTEIVVPAGAALDLNAMITLNETGALLWSELERGSDIDGLTAALLREYDVEEAKARQDAVAFVRRLWEAGWLDT